MAMRSGGSFREVIVRLPAVSLAICPCCRSGGISSVSKTRAAAALAFFRALFTLLALRSDSAITARAIITTMKRPAWSAYAIR